MPFTYHLPTKIIFGQPALEAVKTELAQLQAERVLFVSDPGLAQLGLVAQFTAGLSEAGYAVTPFTEVSSNPTTTEVAAGLALAREQGTQALIGLGGGSAIDVAKGIAMLMTNGGDYADYQWGGKAITERSLPLLAIPTTAGTGSEVSRVAVIVDPANPFKKGVLSPLMFPHAAIVDPELTRSLPPRLTAATGMDAFIHALECYIGRRANPYTDQFCLAALETIWTALPQAVNDGNDMAARQAMLLAALWGGTAMDHAGLGLIHALSGPLTGHLHLHHGLANALILPYALRFNLPAIPPERRTRLNRIFDLPREAGGERLVETLTQFVRRLGLPTHLRELNQPLEGVDWAAIAADTTRMMLLQNNPRPVSAAEGETLLTQMRQ
ncbi:MAG: NAD-dependent alcohol dehydrogenase [Anaerolineae bacterium]|nr:iron-containing alcohol dehydrogenase [Anaerolineales bacterium]MCQ3973791.1 NAD-dependent alcohol dehydrogenase [Anaerolineae bacterium]